MGSRSSRHRERPVSITRPINPINPFNEPTVPIISQQIQKCETVATLIPRPIIDIIAQYTVRRRMLCIHSPGDSYVLNQNTWQILPRRPTPSSIRDYKDTLCSSHLLENDKAIWVAPILPGGSAPLQRLCLSTLQWCEYKSSHDIDDRRSYPKMTSLADGRILMAYNHIPDGDNLIHTWTYLTAFDPKHIALPDPFTFIQMLLPDDRKFWSDKYIEQVEYHRPKWRRLTVGLPPNSPSFIAFVEHDGRLYFLGSRTQLTLNGDPGTERDCYSVDSTLLVGDGELDDKWTRAPATSITVYDTLPPMLTKRDEAYAFSAPGFGILVAGFGTVDSHFSYVVELFNGVSWKVVWTCDHGGIMEWHVQLVDDRFYFIDRIAANELICRSISIRDLVSGGDTRHWHRHSPFPLLRNFSHEYLCVTQI